MKSGDRLDYVFIYSACNRSSPLEVVGIAQLAGVHLVENEQRDGECEAQRAYDNVCYAEEVVL
jgi:hypothetical protein